MPGLAARQEPKRRTYGNTGGAAWLEIVAGCGAMTCYPMGNMMLSSPVLEYAIQQMATLKQLCRKRALAYAETIQEVAMGESIQRAFQSQL